MPTIGEHWINNKINLTLTFYCFFTTRVRKQVPDATIITIKTSANVIKTIYLHRYNYYQHMNVDNKLVNYL